jgi:creatinine amidohydrolase
VLGPAVAIGASGEHAGFAGTLSVGAEVFEEMIVEIGRSADAFDGVIWVNAHGGNSVALRRAHERLTVEGRRSLIARCSTPHGDAHAGRTETSMLLALAPEVVRVDRVEAGEVRPWAELADGIAAGGVIAVSPSGVLGDPTGATADEGERLLAEMVDRLVDLVGGWPAYDR